MLALDSVFRGAYNSKIIFIIRPLHIKLHFLHLYTLEICLEIHFSVLKTPAWFSNNMQSMLQYFLRIFRNLFFQQGAYALQASP